MHYFFYNSCFNKSLTFGRKMYMIFAYWNVCLPNFYFRNISNFLALASLAETCWYTEKTIFPFPFKFNGIWSWWQFSFRFSEPNGIPFVFKIKRKTVTMIISHSMWKELEVCTSFLSVTQWMDLWFTWYQNGWIFLRIVLSAVLSSQSIGHDRKMFACGAFRCGFKSRQHDVAFGVILVSRRNSTMCKHDIIWTGKV